MVRFVSVTMLSAVQKGFCAKMTLDQDRSSDTIQIMIKYNSMRNQKIFKIDHNYLLSIYKYFVVGFGDRFLSNRNSHAQEAVDCV